MNDYRSADELKKYLRPRVLVVKDAIEQTIADAIRSLEKQCKRGERSYLLGPDYFKEIEFTNHSTRLANGEYEKYTVCFNNDEANEIKTSFVKILTGLGYTVTDPNNTVSY